VTLNNSGPIKTIKNSIIKIILVVAAICLSLIASEAAIQADGRNITQIDITGNYGTEHWQGFYGTIADEAISIRNYNKKNNDVVQNFYLNILVHEGDYLFITNSSLPPVISELHAGSIESVDEITGKGYDSGSNTFTYFSTYRIPYTGIILYKVPVLYMFNGRQRTDYLMEGLLEDANGNLVFVVQLNDFPYENNNFSFMLPYNNNLTYSIFYLPSQEYIHLE
jgi:hypothetical protein